MRTLVLSVILLAGCVQKTAAPALTRPSTLPLSTSTLDTMRASVEIPADGLWAAEAIEKPSAADWLLADQDAADLAAAATLISLPGTGLQDAARVTNADWQAWARDIQKTALEARAAARAKDLTKFTAAADHLTETCESCHTKYRPQNPSDGVARYPFYPPRTRDASSGFVAP